MSKAPEESKPAGKTSMTADYAGRDMVADVLRDYESAASTRSARIARAKAVDAVAKAKWSREAVTWLRNEELRQIAYGRISAPMDYAKRYKGLSPKDRKVVDAVLGSGR